MYVGMGKKCEKNPTFSGDKNRNLGNTVLNLRLFSELTIIINSLLLFTWDSLKVNSY